MEMKNPVLEAVRVRCQQNGTHFAALARRMKVKRTSIYRLLSGTVTNKTVDKVATALNLTRAELERWLLDEWQRALASGCEVEPPRIHWRYLTPSKGGLVFRGEG